MTNPGVWVASGPGLPCGGRVLGEAAQPGRVWVDVCVIGQHLPQMYRAAELHELTADGCVRLGLCPDCLGFGDLDPGLAAGMLETARGIDQIRQPCPGCGGTGRPALRVTLKRDAGGVEGSIRPLPHEYVPPVDGQDVSMLMAFRGFGVQPGMCLACGMPEDSTGPRGEALHEEQAA